MVFLGNMYGDRFNAAESLKLDSSTIVVGDAASTLRRLPDDCVQAIVTSPPYWGLRDYGIEGQIGLEGTLDAYIENLIGAFREAKRVLRSDGILWVNIGDGYTSGNRGYRAPDKKNPARAMSIRPNTPDGLKPKDLQGIPWRLAFALRDDGWFLRSEIIWHKPNVTPESVKDRPTRSHEHLFMLSKSERYYYDYDASLEPASDGSLRNRRTVWSVNTQPAMGDHSATFPPKLIEPCILTSTKAGDWVLDPFFGLGTVGSVCSDHDRRYFGIELNPDYAASAEERLRVRQGVIRFAA